MKIKEHNVILRAGRVVLRPMTEDDWHLLSMWNADADVLYFAEEPDAKPFTVEQVQEIYRGVSQTAFCFIIEVDGNPIGDCWLQQMNLDRIRSKYLGRDCRRIDLLIGEKAFWGHGYGTEVIRVLTKFAFEQEHADMVFGCGIADYNPRSLRAFEKAGYRVEGEIVNPPGSKVRSECDVAITREDYEKNNREPNKAPVRTLRAPC